MEEVDASQTDGTSQKKSGMKVKVIGAVGAVVLLEAAGIFLALKLFGGGPQQSRAESLMAAESEPTGPHNSAEIKVAHFRAPNEKTGQLFVFDLKVAAVVRLEDQNQVEDLVRAYEGRITDRLIRVVRAADPDQLREEELGSLRRQIKYELDKLLEDDTIIEEILIPYFQKYRSDL